MDEEKQGWPKCGMSLKPRDGGTGVPATNIRGHEPQEGDLLCWQTETEGRVEGVTNEEELQRRSLEDFPVASRRTRGTASGPELPSWGRARREGPEPLGGAVGTAQLPEGAQGQAGAQGGGPLPGGRPTSAADRG